MDTTIDISGKDQCAFVLHYVIESKIFERLIALKCVTSTTAETLLNSLKQVLTKVGIPIENCIADAFDGVSNMSGIYNGLSAKLIEIIPIHIHTWCAAHVFNLVLCDTADIVTETTTLFNILQRACVFVKESIKRQNIFANENQAYKL